MAGDGRVNEKSASLPSTTCSMPSTTASSNTPRKCVAGDGVDRRNVVPERVAAGAALQFQPTCRPWCGMASACSRRRSSAQRCNISTSCSRSSRANSAPGRRVLCHNPGVRQRHQSGDRRRVRAYRLPLGHSMLLDEVDRFDPTFQQDTGLGLIEAFLNPLAFDLDGTLNAEEAAGAIVRGTTARAPTRSTNSSRSSAQQPAGPPARSRHHQPGAAVTPALSLQAARSEFYDVTGDIARPPTRAGSTSRST